MDKGIFAIIVATCVGGGACLGGYNTLSQDFAYDRALSDPDFYYLVDETGNPVSELSD